MTRHVGTTDEVVEAFVAGRPMRTVAAKVPGGQRVQSVFAVDPTLTLFNYRTAIAERRIDGTFAVGLRKYTVTTSKLQGHLRATLAYAGYAPSASITSIRAAVPGRHGGFGIPWHSTGWENVPAEVWTR